MKQKKIKFITHKEIWAILSIDCIQSNKLSGGQSNFLKAVKALTPKPERPQEVSR